MSAVDDILAGMAKVQAKAQKKVKKPPVAVAAAPPTGRSVFSAPKAAITAPVKVEQVPYRVHLVKPPAVHKTVVDQALQHLCAVLDDEHKVLYVIGGEMAAIELVELVKKDGGKPHLFNKLPYKVVAINRRTMYGIDLRKEVRIQWSSVVIMPNVCDLAVMLRNEHGLHERG